MCEIDDFGFVEFSRRIVTTRVVHECGSCLKDWPKGSRMEVVTGKWDGDVDRLYACEVCRFAQRQRDHAPLHFCWGHFWGHNDQEIGDEEVYEYIKARLAAGATPLEADAIRVRELAAEALAAE